MKNKVPIPSLERLCSIYHILEQLEKNGTEKVSSAQLGKELCVNAYSVRKDISYFGEIGNCRAGYEVSRLKEHLKVNLGFDIARTICVVGLGRLGCAILDYGLLPESDFSIVAGFDSNINKLETIHTDIPLYPAHEIVNVVKRKKIELGVIAVPGDAAAETARRLSDGGVRGIVNFSPAVIKSQNNVFIRNMDLVGEFRILSVLTN
jgi:redox-sensing transcriptional repressor